jgi:hypothetical protein
MDALLTDLRATLDRLGYVVVPHGEYLCVRLSLAASIRIYSSNGRIRLEPRSGPFGRTGAMVGTSAVGVGAVAATAFALSSGALVVVTAFVGIVALAHEACRFVLTEGCMTRLQQLVRESERAAPPAAGLPPAPNEIGSEYGFQVGAQPGRRAAIPVSRPGQE